jgi:hypothetical protein
MAIRMAFAADNLRRDSLVEVCRNTPPFVTIRDDYRLEAKCGECE